jgi:lysophospholipase L1-like esterase
LEKGIRQYRFLPKYDFVTLLIGVNNQYRDREVMEYKLEFEELLKKAITYSNNKTNRVAVLSIPDYSVTPFAQNMNREKIAREIEVFNSVAKAISIQYKVHFMDITPGSREAEKDFELVAEDKLHPSQKEYKKWAEKLAEIIAQQLK